MSDQSKNKLNINVRSFLTAIAVIFALMVCAYLLTLVIPGGLYPRIEDAGGNQIIDTAGTFTYTQGGISFVKWLLSPVLVLGAAGSGTLIAVIVFLLVIGGIFNALDQRGLMKYMLDQISGRCSAMRYQLMAVIILFFMSMGSLIGSFEECVPLVPIVVALAVRLGWDTLTGVGMSLLAAGCGFAAGVCNPFTIGVAQQLAGLPLFSGISMRLLSFVLIYALLLAFIVLYARKIAKPLKSIQDAALFVPSAALSRGVSCFVALMGTGIAVILSSGFIAALQDYTMIITAAAFLIAGVCACLASGMSAARFASSFLQGMTSIFPAVLMILMASSIRYTLEEAHVLDTLLHEAVRLTDTLPRWSAILFIYLLVLVMNFFIASGSAKAFMLIPIIVPIAQIFGISAQLCILAFAFGDGFSNVFYPTNPALLISLGLADVSYGSWFRWSWKFQFLNLLLTSAILLFGYAVGY